MKIYPRYRVLGRTVAMSLLGGLLATSAMAAAPISPQSIPGSADVSRVKPDEGLLAPLPGIEAPLVFPESSPDLPVPQGAENIKFVLHQVVVKGATAFTEEELAELYVNDLDQDVTLATAYRIAGDITRHYRNEGYFLTLATIPDQKIEDGVLTIQVTEGYIGDVDLQKEEAQYYVVDAYIDRVKSEKPIKAETLERFLLQINDLPGWSFRAVLSQAGPENDGAVKLTLVPTEKAGTGFLSFDNYNSRYLGPHEATASYSTSLIPYEQTTVSAINSVPFSRLHYGAINQQIPVWPDVNFNLGASSTKVEPGYSLTDLEIVSHSNTLSAGFDYQLIRQRQMNLSTNIKLDARDTQSNTLGVRITDDAIRALRVGANFDLTDSWYGFNTAQIVYSHGLDGIGSSEANESNLSRAEAKPNFQKVEISLSRLQQIDEDWAIQARGTGQFASGALYSAEEYGYGGQLFGRAFDSSELIGDQGASGSIELRYGGFADLEPIALQPFTFYDYGVVTNFDLGQPTRQTASSAGLGVRFSTPWNQSGNVTASLPLIRDEATPIYGFSDHGPRISFQVTQGF